MSIPFTDLFIYTEGDKVLSLGVRERAVQETAFGERLRNLIESQYPSLRAFGSKVLKDNGEPVEETYISRILNGHVKQPGKPMMRRIASALGMSLSELERATGIAEPDEDDDSDRGVILALMMAHHQAGPMLIRLKAEAPVEDYPALLEEALDHFAMGLGRQLRKRREDEEKQ